MLAPKKRLVAVALRLGVEHRRQAANLLIIHRSDYFPREALIRRRMNES